jgi:cysteine synthase
VGRERRVGDKVSSAGDAIVEPTSGQVGVELTLKELGGVLGLDVVQNLINVASA